MTENSLWRLAAIAAVAVALCAAIFLPVNPLGLAPPGAPHDAAWFAAVMSGSYMIAYDLMILLMSAAAVVFAILMPLLAPQLGRWLVYGLPLALLGCVLMASAGVFDAHVAPALAANAATQEFLSLRGPLLGGALHGVFGTGGLLFAAANIALAAALERTGMVQFVFAGALAVGAIGIGLHPMLGPVLRGIGFGLFALSYLRLGVACWRRAAAPRT